MAAKIEPTERQSAGAAAGSDDELNQQLHAIIEDLQRAGLQPNHPEEDEPVERDDLSPGIAPYLDHDASERKAIYDRLVAIEKEIKRRRSRGFARYLVAICIGVAGTLAWQSYGDAAKQVIATRAPELGWSPEAKQVIASWTVGWTKPPASPERIAPEPVASSKAPPGSSVDPAQVQQIAQSLAALRETVEQIAAGQDQTSREMARVESAVAELILKFPEPSAQPPAAPEHKRVPPSSRAPTAPTPRH
jgi:hypothetical protein